MIRVNDFGDRARRDLEGSGKKRSPAYLLLLLIGVFLLIVGLEGDHPGAVVAAAIVGGAGLIGLAVKG